MFNRLWYKVSKALMLVGNVLSSGGMSLLYKDYEKARGNQHRRDRQIAEQGTLLQKIALLFSTGGFSIFYAPSRKENK